MTTPIVESTSTSSDSGTTSHAVTLPSGVVSGDVLIVQFVFRAVNGGVSFPAGWTIFRNVQEHTLDIFALAWRLATGGETSVTVTTTDSANSAHIAYRISGAENPSTQPPEASGSATGSGISPNPPNLTPTGGAKDYLWLAPVSRATTGTITTLPTGFSVGLAASTSGNTAFSSRRALNATSLNPGAYTLSAPSDDWIAVTVAIHPTALPIVDTTGTVISAPSLEADIVAGGKTIILTVTNATWDADIGSDNSQTQDLIDGIDSDLTGAAGWDAVVKAGLAFGNVARTSDTVVTITLPTFAGYNTAGNETITVIVPASALSSDDPVTANPTFGVEAFPTNAPVVEATNSSTDDGSGGTHTVDLPAGIIAGELLIILFVDDSGFTGATLSGWTKLGEAGIVGDPSGRINCAVFYKFADGTEGASVTVTTTFSNDSAHHSYRISLHLATSPPEISSITLAVTASPNPPSLTPSGGEDNFLWLAMAGALHGWSAVTPANYTDLLTKDGAGVGAASAQRNRNIATENPGAFSVGGGTSYTAALVVAVYPVPPLPASIGGPVGYQQREILL